MTVTLIWMVGFQNGMHPSYGPQSVDSLQRKLVPLVLPGASFSAKNDGSFTAVKTSCINNILEMKGHGSSMNLKDPNIIQTLKS